MSRLLQFFIFGIIIILITLGVIKATKEKTKSESLLEIIETDKAFSKKCFEEGMSNSFSTFADDGVYKISEGAYPIIGRKELEKNFNAKSTKDFKLQWYPVKAEVAESGDMGYTTGNWKITTPDSTVHSCYESMRKRQKDGTWKYVLDGGSACPDPEKNPNKLKPL